jgi:hypothetical protein
MEPSNRSVLFAEYGYEVLAKLVDANHQTLDQGVVDFVIPNAI